MTQFDFKAQKIHKYAALWPLANIESLTEDIRKHGQLKLIELFMGEVIDGRCRLKACEILRITPLFVDKTRFLKTDDDVLEYVKSMNNRRNLTTGQKAAVAYNLFQVTKKKYETIAKAYDGVSKTMEISSRNIQYVEEILKKNWAVFQEVFEGKLKIQPALTKIKCETVVNKRRESKMRANFELEIFFEPLACEKDRYGIPLDEDLLEKLKEFEGKTVRVKMVC